jgi:hypothetical protein
MNDRLTNFRKVSTLNFRLAFVLLLLPLLVATISTTTAQEDGRAGSEAEVTILSRIVTPTTVETTMQFWAIGDAYVSSAFPDSSFGTHPDLRVGYDPVTYQAERSLLRFDISSLPSGAQIQSAELQLNQSSATPVPDPHFGGLFSIEARYLVADWSESTITWNSSNSILGDAIGVGEFTVDLGVKTGNATEAVQAWYSGARPNYGFQLQGDETPERGRQRNFDSKEAGGFVPTLIVDYTTITDTCPPTTTVDALPAWSPASFSVSWSGTDCGSDGQEPSGIANYDVQYSTDGATWHDWKTDTQDTSGTFDGDHGVTYWFQARATDNAQNVGSWSSSQSTQVDSVPPTATIDLPGIGGNDGYNFPDLEVFWTGNDDLSGIQSYELEWRPLDGSWTSQSFPSTQTSAWVNGLTVGGSYELQVRSLDNANNTGEWSLTATTIVSDPDSLVQPFDPVIVVTDTLTVKWNGFSNSVISNYEVKYRMQGGSWQTWDNFPGTQSSAVFDAGTLIPGWPNIAATIVDFEVAATAQNQPPEAFSGVAEANVIFDPQETMAPTVYLPVVIGGS